MEKLKGFSRITLKIGQQETEIKKLVEEGMKSFVWSVDENLQKDDGKSGNLFELFVGERIDKESTKNEAINQFLFSICLSTVNDSK